MAKNSELTAYIFLFLLDCYNILILLAPAELTSLLLFLTQINETIMNSKW